MSTEPTQPPLGDAPEHAPTSWSARVFFIAILLGISAVWAAHAWAYRWLCDDAYISFRYARQWLRGEGLVFNPGETVEGYTNFLWIVELTGLWWLTGLAPLDTAWALSAFWTVALVATLAWVSFRGQSFRAGAWVLALTTAWLAIQPHVAVWSTSGLETRQFTTLVVLGIALVTTRKLSLVGCLLGSVVLGLAALTRPEGMLVFACCGVWVVIYALAHKRTVVAQVIAFVLPFALIIAAQLYFRYTFYGEWLPNTYYAKHVRAWPEAGLTYVFAFVLENGFFVLLPVALVGLWWRWAHRGDGFLWLALGLVSMHCGYVVTIGGDHFIYRPFDFYFPIVFLACAEGTVAVMKGIENWTRRLPGTLSLAYGSALGCSLFVVLGLYTALLPIASTVTGSHVTQYQRNFHPELTSENASYLFWLPGMPRSVESLNEARARLIPQGISVRWREHKLLWEDYKRFWAPYEAIAGEGVIPPDAVAAFGTVGIMPYHLIDLTVIDTFGLTDKVVARNPVTKPNSERYMAHDREVPFGYLQERGFNFSITPASESLDEALSRGHFVYKIHDTLWMPFDSGYHDWVKSAFDADRLYERMVLDDNIPAKNRTFFQGVMYEGRRFLGRFDNSLDGWTRYGDAMTDQPAAGSRPNQMPVLHFTGRGLINSFHAETLDAPTGWVRSPKFVPQANDMLQFLIAGGSNPACGVRLWVNDSIVQQWHGRDGEVLGPVQFDMAPFAGQEFWIEIYDDNTGAWGHVLADHFILMSPMQDKTIAIPDSSS